MELECEREKIFPKDIKWYQGCTPIHWRLIEMFKQVHSLTQFPKPHVLHDCQKTSVFPVAEHYTECPFCDVFRRWARLGSEALNMLNMLLFEIVNHMIVLLDLQHACWRHTALAVWNAFYAPVSTCHKIRMCFVLTVVQDEYFFSWDCMNCNMDYTIL